MSWTDTPTEAMLWTPGDLQPSEIQRHVEFLLYRLQQLVDTNPDGEVARLYLQQMQDIGRFVLMQSEPTVHRENDAPTTDDRSALVRFGRELMERRRKAQLTRVALARITGLSEATLKLIEKGHSRPTRNTLMRLLVVKKLQLSQSDVEGILRTNGRMTPIFQPVEHHVAPELNFLVMPEYDNTQMFLNFVQFLQGSGGHIEQTYLYLDPLSVLDYISMKKKLPCFQNKAATSFHEMAKRIMSKHDRFEIVVLGSGDGQTAVQFIRILSEVQQEVDLDVILVDISQSLLTTAYHHSMQVLGKIPGIRIVALQGNFLQFQTLPPKPLRTDSRRRIVVLLGFTFSTLDQGFEFLANKLRGPLGELDFLLIDVLLAYGKTDKEITDNDPLLRDALPSSLRRWLERPLSHSLSGTARIRFQTNLDTRSLPRSYLITINAVVESLQKDERVFSMLRIRRYEPKFFARQMELLGWTLVSDIGKPPNDKSLHAATMLFRRNTLHLVQSMGLT
jgi:transcriptional regulator with XRE-family HTH domain